MPRSGMTVRKLRVQMISRLKQRLRLRTRWNLYRTLIETIGMRAVIDYKLRAFGLRGGSEYWIQPKRAAYPLCVRTNSSDLNVFQQIFVEREYSCLDTMTDARLIVDCGANVGYSSAYFLSKFPGCQVVAVEPDPGIFAALQRNLANYGSRATLIHGGIWSHTAPLVISQDLYRDGREWTRQVRMAEPGEAADVEGVDVGSILSNSGHDRISILKMDIEGAEAVVFSENCQSWLDKIDTIAIELHDDSSFGNASEIFFKAIHSQGFQISRSGELTICQRPSLDPGINHPEEE
ncbi:MAG: FkbM family methyltransferase [Isosphaeraceae bacterium]